MVFHFTQAKQEWKNYRDQGRLTFLVPLHQTLYHQITLLFATRTRDPKVSLLASYKISCFRKNLVSGLDLVIIWEHHDCCSWAHLQFLSCFCTFQMFGQFWSERCLVKFQLKQHLIFNNNNNNNNNNDNNNKLNWVLFRTNLNLTCSW